MTNPEMIPEFRTFLTPILTPFNYRRKCLSEVEFSICWLPEINPLNKRPILRGFGWLFDRKNLRITTWHITCYQTCPNCAPWFHRCTYNLLKSTMVVNMINESTAIYHFGPLLTIWYTAREQFNHHTLIW